MKKNHQKQNKTTLKNFFEVRSARMMNPLTLEKEPCSFIFFLN